MFQKDCQTSYGGQRRISIVKKDFRPCGKSKLPRGTEPLVSQSPGHGLTSEQAPGEMY